MDQDKLIESTKENIHEELDETINDIDIKLQELEIQIDQLQLKMSLAEDHSEYLEEYNDLKQLYKELLKQKKLEQKAQKQKAVNKWDQLRSWVLIYAIIVGILCLPYIGMIIWSTFSGWILNLFEGLESIHSTSYPLFVAILLLLYYSLPIILLLISWLIYVNFVRDGFEKKVFKYIFIGQGVLTLGNALYLFFGFILETL